MNFIRPNIRHMHGYSFGEQPADPTVIKLNTNEHALPPSPAVAAALARFDTADLRRYPEPTALPLRRRLADLHDLDTRQVIATRGGDELLRLLFTTCIAPDNAFGMITPGYSLYTTLARIADSRIIEYSLTAPTYDLPADLASRMNDDGIRFTCIVNPHAPSGRLYARDTIQRFLDEFRGLVLLDEAYADFVSPQHAWNSPPLLAEHDNLVILRSLSKGYALAGLRVGYGLGQADLIDTLVSKTRDSYNLDAIAQCLALAALDDQTHARASWETVRQARESLRDRLQQLGFQIPASETNFLLARLPAHLTNLTAQAVYQALKARGILVRWFDQPDIRDALRITVGNAEENARLLATLQTILHDDTE